MATHMALHKIPDDGVHLRNGLMRLAISKLAFHKSTCDGISIFATSQINLSGIIGTYPMNTLEATSFQVLV